MADFRVFLSAVSSEFGSARDTLAASLRSRDLLLRVQSDFHQEAAADTTLRKLHDYIRDCSAVVCIIGLRSGAMPPAASAAPFACHPWTYAALVPARKFVEHRADVVLAIPEPPVPLVEPEGACLRVVLSLGHAMARRSISVPGI
jgi:Domain of unknown function (DUF4062)